MSRVVRTDRNQTWDAAGNLVAEEVVEVDVTVDAVEYALHDHARKAYAANRTYLGLATPTAAQNLAQIRSLTRQVQALLRLGPLRDLLDDEVID